MTVWNIRLFATWLGVAFGAVPAVLAQKPAAVEAPEAADDARERKVMERFLAVLEKTPRRGTALDRVYGYHVERGSLEAFLKTYRDRVLADSKDGGSWLLVGLVEGQRGRDSAAVEAFRKAEAARPDDPLPAYYLGQALVLVGQPDAAAEAFERALLKKPSRADLLEVYQALGRVHQRAHRNDKALAVWDRLEKAFPDDPRVQEQIAHALADESQDAAALARFEALAKSTKDRFRQVQFAIEAAELKVRVGKSPEALVDFEALLGKLDPESWLYREVRRKVEEVFLRTDDLAGLAAYYERWIKKAPDDVEAMARLGRTLAGQGRGVEARKWLEEAVKLAPSRRELRLALIEQLAQDRKFAEAAGRYEALARLEPNNPDVVRDWGRMLLRDTSKPEADRKRSAAIVWRRLAPDDAKDAVGIAQAADLFRQAGLTDEAIALYLRAIELAPESTQYREYLGEYYHALKRTDEALATWRAAADGKSRNARTLARLGEVLSGFGYREQAIEPLSEAVRLEPDDFDLRIKLADLKLALDRPTEALPELEKAETLAAAAEQAEAVLGRQIRAFQALNSLGSQTERLENALIKAPTAAGWTRLARLLEANQKTAEAARAIGEATKLDPKSVPAWVANARLLESSGDLLGSAQALLTLATIDRRSKTDYLTGIARLEARLGRRGPALDAGRELLAAAPGNPENHQFFAELCFQLGETDEGLDTLRRSARANPSDPKATLTLAENLARQFRAEEAIELYWRAFVRTIDVEGKLAVVGRMTEQYLQRNQLDRLIGRLERELREPSQQRELSLCLAQAHATSGDYSSARLELERLLSTNPRDAQLLAQLSNLAEQEGDASTASKYQKQAQEIAPSAEGTNRLAQLFLRAGEYAEAESIWTRNADSDQDPARALSAIDNLLAAGKREPVLLITARLLRTKPDDWELLYREGVALAGLNRSADAEARFLAILALKLGDDEKGMMARSRSGGGWGKTPGTTRLPAMPIQERISLAPRLRSVVGIDPVAGQVLAVTPLDYGQARLAAIAWRLGLALRENRQDDLLKACREAKEKAPADPRAAWDWYSLQVIRQDYLEVFEAAAALARLLPADTSAQWAFLSAMANRTTGPNQQRVYRQPGSTAPDPTPALPAPEVDRVLACYDGFQARRPDLAVSLLSDVLTELKRANRTEDADRIYRRAMASATPGSSGADVLGDLAGDRGDFDGLMAYMDKLEHTPAAAMASASTGQANPSTTLAQIYGRTIGLRGSIKAYPDVLAVLDRSIATGTRSRATTLSGLRSSVSKATANRNNNNAVSYWINGQSMRGIGLDFPTVNDRHDQAAIGVIRTAYEVFHRDDLMSDLFGHLQTRADGAKGLERADLLLALTYCRWWNDDKVEAEEAVVRAAEAAGPEPSIRMLLAELYERQGSMLESLGALDSVDAIDSDTVMRRENQALRLAVATGNVDRARKAAERLFGLRLDAEAQVQLASLMNQLGMHELAEAVLARARKAAGNKPPSLLILMNQYQRQQKSDQALQVALQILRLRPNSTTSTGQAQTSAVVRNTLTGSVTTMVQTASNTGVEDDYARREAMQVLSRSGKLNDLVARAEAQLDRSPNSMQVLQTLAEYARVANDKDKTRALSDRMARTRPDDARLRVQLGTQLAQGGDPAGALDHFRAAVKADPSILANQFNPIINAFRQAGKFEEFATMIEAVDLRAIGNINTVTMIAQYFMNDAQTKDRGMALFRRIWATFPLDRASTINLLGSNDDWWRLPEVFSYARDVVIPANTATTVRPWAGLDVVQSFGNDGRINTLANRLLDASVRQNKVIELESDVRRAIERHPGWSGGKALMSLLALRDGRIDETRSIVRSLMAEAKEPMPSVARWLIGQDLEDHSELQSLAEELYEAAVRDLLARSTFEPNDNLNPFNKLLVLYKTSGRLVEGRDLMLKLARAKRSNPAYAPAYVEAQRIFAMTNYAQQLIGLGFPDDAVGLYREQIAEVESMRKDPLASQYINVDGMVQQSRQGIQQALRALKPEAIAATIARVIRPDANRPAATEGVDLYLSVIQLTPERESVVGGMAEILRKLATKDGTSPEFASSLDALLLRTPDDFATNVAAALVAFSGSKPGEIDAATTRLLGLVERTPLEALPAEPGRAAPRPNARQKADAARQLGLWLVARECWTRAGWKPMGDRFAARAVEAARRNADPRWPRAMLREWGQVELDLGDRDQAERRWSDLLELILTRPASRRRDPKEGRPEPPQATPRENFDRAILLAWMAADRGLTRLSIRAVRDAFRGGSPVGVQLGIDAANVTIGGSNQAVFNTVRASLNMVRNRRVSNNADDGSGEATTGPILVRVAELEGLWSLGGLPPREAYEVLRDVVLPADRPTEVDLYPLGLGLATARQPKSLGRLLATRAVQVGATEELRQAVRSRLGNPLAELSGLVLQIQVELASGRPEAASALLDQVEARLAKDTLRASAEIAAHAALPALEFPGSEKSASLVLDRAIRALASRSGLEPVSSLLQAMGGHDLDRQRLEPGRARYREYLDLQEKWSAQNQANNPESLNFYRRALILRGAAAFARRELVPDALELLGRYADIPSTRYLELSPNGTLAAIAVGLAKLPAFERYRLLKEWTLPSGDRKTIRSVVAFLSESNIPPAVFGVANVIPPGGVLATSSMLIEAAREAGTLDELAIEVRALDEKSVEEAAPLRILIEVARGKGAESLARVEAMADALEKAIADLSRPGAPPIPPGGIQPTAPFLTGLVASACLRDEKLAPAGDRLARALIRRPWNGVANGSVTPVAMLARLRLDLLRSQAARASSRDLPVDPDPGLGSWHLARTAWGNPLLAPVGPAWFEHDGHVGLQGPNPSDVLDLAFAYPLAGSFEFSVDARSTPSDGEASVSFGGQPFAFRNLGVVQNNGMNPNSSRAYRAEGANRVTIRVEPGKVRAMVNGLVVAEDNDPDPTYPWLALTGKGQASWGSFDLVGRPEIPREVRLSHGDRLGGWQATAYSEILAPRAPNPSVGPDFANFDGFDWSSRDGEIRGRKVDDAASQANLQSRLAYSRAMRDGESISYAFLYEPGRIEVHPTLGRLAFLIAPEGVRLHWLTDGPGLDPSGLAADNAVDDPSSRRGSSPIPLKPNAWNQARLALAKGVLRIELNGQPIFERPVASTDDRTFGLFHDKDRTACRVSDVVLRGDWPEAFEAARAAGLLARTRPTDDLDRRARHAMIGEAVLTEDAGGVLERTRSLPIADRYEALAAWVLPDANHPTFRLQGRFTPLDPALLEGLEESPAPPPGPSRVQVGGDPESPASDLVEVARVAAKLDELTGRVESARTSSTIDERGRLALRAMIRLAQNNEEGAIADLETLKGLAGTIKPADPDWTRWPQLIAGRSAMANARVRASGLAVLVVPTTGSGEVLGASDLWVRQVRQARAVGEALDRGAGLVDPGGLAPWVPISMPRASDRGRGFPRTSWTTRDGRLENRSGRPGDFLLLNLPIRGAFEVSAELSAEPGREANLAYGGIAVRVRPDRKGIKILEDEQAPQDVTLSLPPELPGEWADWKLRVVDGRMIVSIGGRPVFERTIPTDVNPWLAIETPGPLGGSARGVSIVGKPVVPDRLRIASRPDLSGWSSGEYSSIAVGNESGWKKRGDEIFGRSASSSTAMNGMNNNNVMFNRGGFAVETWDGVQPGASAVGSRLESVLRYRRPMLEDGTIAYEFYHDPGKAMVHPSLDRLAFLIHPDGVAIHRLTDLPYDRAGLGPGNAVVEPSRRKGPPSLPIRPKAWNHLKLALMGHVVTITLNDVLIYERPLEPTNARTFGLFHFADESEARVRNVTYQGDWPRSLPAR